MHKNLVQDSAFFLCKVLHFHFATHNGYEKISSSLLKKVAKPNFRLVQDKIEAIRLGDRKLIEKYDDLKPSWVETNEYVEVLGKKISLHGQIASEHERAVNKSKKDEFLQELVEFAQEYGLSIEEATQLAVSVSESNNGMMGLSEQKLIVAQEILKRKMSQSAKEEEKSIAKKARKKVTEFINKKDIRYIASEAKKQKKSIEEALKEANIIKAFDEFLIT